MSSLNENYVAYHTHSDYSVLDSCTDFRLYVDKAVALGQKAIAFTEHGRPLGWIAKKMYCDEKGIKFIRGVECYLTEKLYVDENSGTKYRDNYHTILIAKNDAGASEINELIYNSTKPDHFYFTNRITFDEFLHISDNVIKISACVASPLNKLPITHPMYESLARKYDYYEIQPHKFQEQVDYNRHLAMLSEQYGKPLIAATDAHSLDKFKDECREVLLRGKDRWYADGGECDLTYKSFDELVTAFREQGALPESIWMEAIRNTNAMADEVEDFTVETSIKYPILYGSAEKDTEMFRKTVYEKYQDKLNRGIIPMSQKEDFDTGLEEELRVFEKVGMSGFMLSMSETISWCHDNGIPTGNARGSVGGSKAAYVSDIIDLNPVTWKTVFSRFCNEDRKEIGDVDIDCIEADRPKIFEHIINKFGERKTARVPSYGTIVEKGTIEYVVKGLSSKELNPEYNSRYKKGSKTDWSKMTYNGIKVYTLIENIKNLYSSKEDEARKQYPEIFKYFDGIIGTKISYSVHPAGIVISPIDLVLNYGVFDKDGDNVLTIDMDEIHEVGLAKYDFLILKNVGIIQDVYKMIGKKYPRSDEIDWNDQNVWSDMIASPVGIFQMEGAYAFGLLKKYEPHSIFDMSLVTAAIRPSGASYRDDLIAHKPFKNPSAIIDELLKDNWGYLVYQEDTIKFLQQICGLSGSEADNVRRAIGRKDKDRLNRALPKILDGYCSMSSMPRPVAEQEANVFLKIIEDSASYQFGYNHSIAYCMVGYMCAYLRYYYTGEFIVSYLNNAANQEDIIAGTELAKERGINIKPVKFRYSHSTYRFDKGSNSIYKGMASIKYMNANVADSLFALKDNTYNSFIEVLQDVCHIVDSRQLSILITLGYFSEFGSSGELREIADLFSKVFNHGTSKTINPNKLPLSIDYTKYCETKGKSGKELTNYVIKDLQGIMNEVETVVRGKPHSDISIKNMIEFQLVYLGYCDYVSGKECDRQTIIITSIFPVKRKSDGVKFGYNIIARSIGTGKESRFTILNEVYDKSPVKEMDVICVQKFHKNIRGFWYIDEYKKG